METVLITGAARRLGGIIAEFLASEGHFVWIHYRTHREDAYLLRDRIRNSGGMCECVHADLIDTDQIDDMLRLICESGRGDLTALINSASLFASGTIKETTSEMWDRVMDTNLKAVWYLSNAFACSFPTAKKIITIGDASVQNGYAGHAVYGLSKFALKYLTLQMAEAYAPKVKVNLLSPGLVLKGDQESEESWKKRIESIPGGNSGIIESVLQSIRYLMSDPGVNGSELVVDNGLHLYGIKKLQ